MTLTNKKITLEKIYEAVLANSNSIENMKIDILKLSKKTTKDKKEVLSAIANLAVNSPTIRMHQELEKRVEKLEYRSGHRN